MPRATSSQGSDQAALLAGLRKALSGVTVPQGPDGLFPKSDAGKRLLQEATERGYLQVHQQSVPAAKPRGKPRQVDVAELTDQGRQFLLETDSPKAVLEALLPAVRALAPSQSKGNEAATACVAAIREGFATFQKSVDAAFAKLEQTVLTAIAPVAARPAADPAAVLAALQAALAKLGAPAPALHPTPPAPTPHPVPVRQSIAPSREQVRQTLREAYDHLRLFKEFRDGLVEMPRLYKEAAERLPGLTVDQFHRELQAMTDERKIELHKLNEFQQAKDRDLAIETNDRLYYYVFWK